MTTPIFPSAVHIEYPVRTKIHWKTLINMSEGGIEQRISKWFRGIREVEANCHLMDKSTEADVLMNFSQARKGTYEPFMFVFGNKRNYQGQFVGQGNASELHWLIPFKSYTNLKIYKDGVLQTITTHYTVDSGNGTGGCDVVVFVTAPANGAVITADADDAYLVLNMRLLEAFEDEYMTLNRYRSTLKLIEVKDMLPPYDV